MTPLSSTLYFVSSFLAALIGVEAVRRYSNRQNLLDVPNDRSSHSIPTPRGGGLAIVLVVVIGFVFCLTSFPSGSWKLFLGYLLGASLISWISWKDDRKPMANRWRFLVHCSAAVLVLILCGFWRRFVLTGSETLSIGWLGLPLTFFWIVGLTNAFNFMDGIDGIAGSQALLAGAGWAIIGFLRGESDIAILGLLLSGASLGFLIHNWAPARIFMGDVGSTFLGFTFAVIPVIAAARDPKLAIAGALLVWPFVLDTLFTLVRRLSRKENVFAAHRSHLYQRLILTGVSHGVVSLIYSCFSLIGMMLALLYLKHGNVFFPFLIIGFVFVWFVMFVAWRERSYAKRKTERLDYQKTII